MKGTCSLAPILRSGESKSSVDNIADECQLGKGTGFEPAVSGFTGQRVCHFATPSKCLPVLLRMPRTQHRERRAGHPYNGPPVMLFYVFRQVSSDLGNRLDADLHE